jgi:uncharacterized protein (TIGR02646 family)
VRHIYKSAEPAELLAWKVGKNWQGNPPPWLTLSSGASGAIRTTTSSDQRELCCYCTGTIGTGAFHIEHFRPQTSYPQLRFAWLNLLASCESYKKESFEGEPVETQLHCGHRKGDWFEEGITTDPQFANVEMKFRYPLSGKITPNKSLNAVDYAAVQTTIDNLNLNAPSLQLRRRASLAQAAKDANTISKEEWLARYLPDDAASLPEFWAALKYNYEKHWAPRFDGA